MLVDSHCHLNYLDAPSDALGLARAQGVSGFLCIGVEEATAAEVIGFAQAHPDVWASVGQHPEAAVQDPAWIEALMASPAGAPRGVVAMGEMGLDFFHCSDDAALQQRQQTCFDYQLDLAGRLHYPAVIHTRNAEAETRHLLSRHSGVTGVLHCFTESWELARSALDLGYYISISGIVTFKNGGNVRAVAAKVPRERLLIETDAPWLAPVPHRGKQNQPAFVTDTARFLADWLDWDLAELAQQTTANFFRLFDRADSQAAG